MLQTQRYSGWGVEFWLHIVISSAGRSPSNPLSGSAFQVPFGFPYHYSRQVSLVCLFFLLPDSDRRCDAWSTMARRGLRGGDPCAVVGLLHLVACLLPGMGFGRTPPTSTCRPPVSPPPVSWAHALGANWTCTLLTVCVRVAAGVGNDMSNTVR